jgi:hypothetical protein
MKNRMLLLPIVGIVAALYCSVQPPVHVKGAPGADTRVAPPAKVIDTPDTVIRFGATDGKIELLKDKTALMRQQNKSLEAATKALLAVVEAANARDTISVIDTAHVVKRRSWFYRLIHGTRK